MLKLHNFHTSSTSFRVRIALHLKGLEYEYVPVRLRWQDSEHDSPEYAAFNPQRNVPVLVDGERKIVQSLAIIEYLEETHPSPPLLPSDPGERARVRSLALNVACEIQPVNNLRVERKLASDFGQTEADLLRWRRHWCAAGFDMLEAQLRADPATGKFCHGDTPTLADCVLVPQLQNALRPACGLSLSPWPTIARIHDTCLQHPAFERALPQHQPGYEPLREH